MSLVSRFVTEKQLLLKDLEGKVLVEDAPRTPALSPSKVRTLVASSEDLAVRTARRFVSWWVG
jgi:hypothetical protein